MSSKPASSSAMPQRPRVVILADAQKPKIQQRAAALRPVLEKYVEVVAMIDDLSRTLPTDDADYAVVLGGDGSILRAAHAMGYQQLPVIGLNLGDLGFLAGLQPEQLGQIMPRFLAGEFTVVSHLMFECELRRPEKPTISVLGLNEVAVLAGPPFSMLDVQLYVDDELVTTYSCDGLIVSTPVGSTAHSLSAGGPILRKDLQAFVISPISPHTLTNRPVVDSAERSYMLAISEPNEGTSLVVDGKVIGLLQAQDRVYISRSKAQFQLVEIQGQGYYRTLREKLGWGGRLKPEK